MTDMSPPNRPEGHDAASGRLSRAESLLREVMDAERADRADGAYFVAGDSRLGIVLSLGVAPFLDEEDL